MTGMEKTEAKKEPAAQRPAYRARAARFLAVFFLLGFFFILLKSSLKTTSVTIDELGHLPIGYAYLVTGDSRWLIMNPPSQRVIAALPLLFRNDVRLESKPYPDALGFWKVGIDFMEQNRAIYKSLYRSARLMVCLLACLTGLVVYAFAGSLGGPRAGLIALLLYCLCPYFLAHGGLVTTDLSAAAASVFAMYATYLYVKKRTRIKLLLLALAIGLLFMAKFTVIPFAPLALFYLLAGSRKAGTEDMSFLRRLDWIGFIKEASFIAALVWAILIVVYGGGFFKTYGELNFQSGAFNKVKAHFGWAPIIAPERLVIQADLQAADSAGPWRNYLFGKVTKEASPWYYLICLAYKTPLAFLFLLAACLFLSGRQERLYALLPALFYLVLVSVSTGKLYGARVLLPAMGFFIIFVSVSLAGIKRRFEKKAAGHVAASFYFVCLILISLSTLAAYPDYLSYFNVLAGGPRLPHRGHQVLADSNLDWGQDWIRLARWQREKGVRKIQLARFGPVDPALFGVEYEVAPCPPLPGYLAVSANEALGVDLYMGDEQCLGWLGDEIPFAKVGASVWIYYVPKTGYNVGQGRGRAKTGSVK